MKNFANGWYVIYTQPRHEKKVCDSLKDHNIQFFLPIIKKLKVWSDRKKYIDTPLFPSYVFIYLKDKIDLFRGQNITGVLSYVRMGKELVKVCEDVIADLKLILTTVDDIEVSEIYFKPGQKINIQQGPLTGLSCEIVQLMGKKKILVRGGIIERNIIIPFIPDHYIISN
ncbi:UpxY family transcription antiterminator [Pedobacter sp. WC2423]|uniref:UpxY family transcription antiterminator n=1 Tax=Pedobacter sp. WC2423 TaxID=3234142 RepID=UPI0034667819